MKKIALTFLLLLPVSCTTIRADFSAEFGQYARRGCMVVYDESRGREILYHPELCNTPTLPASTFKIFNSLVSLETGAVPNIDETIKWNGTNYSFPDWNRDQTMRTAFKYSVVWFYQELARRVGTERMAYWLRKAHYGNGDISAGIDVFWLQGGFRVTPREQVDFLRRLYFERLPFSKEAMRAVKQLMLVESTPDYKIYAKTGWVSRESPNVGWWVGFVEKGGNVYFFASRIEEDPSPDFDAAAFNKDKIDVAKNVLRSLGIIE